MPKEIIRAFAYLKKAAAITNLEAGVLSKEKADLIARVCDEILEGKFGEALPAVREAMRSLAKAFKSDLLAQEAFRLYEEIRPGIPEGVSGWGAKGELDLNRLRALAAKK